MTTPTPKTVFFASCRGVFAGGGCRAAAHVGAFEAATQAGVNFSEVAGTSAGSIIAALIGAGASSEYVRAQVGTLEFHSLLTKPKGSSISTGVVGRVLNKLPFVRSKLFGRIGIYGGGYSSIGIERWIDERLAELLPAASRPIKFKDLILPTSIVACDLGGARAKVWSTELTAEEYVSLAVRCSCSIPLFFEPVDVGNSRFVDGGLLSNLPAFVFSDSRSLSDLSGRILAFSLQDDCQPPEDWNIQELLRRLANTVVSGATELQSSMQPRLNVVSIPTGNIKATDFDINSDQIEWLIENGRSAVFRFIENEALHLRSEVQRTVSQVDEDSFSAELVEEARTIGREFAVSMPDTRWFWDFFPTVLAWREGGASINALVEPPSGSPDNRARERQRRTLLAELGATITEKAELPFYGFFLSRSDDYLEAAFIKNPSRTTGTSFGSAYTGAHNRPLMKILKGTLANEFPTPTVEAAQCILRKHSPDELINLLKVGVSQYHSENVTIALEEIPLERVRMLVRMVRTFKFSQISHLVKLYDRFNLPLFVPAEVMIGQKQVSLVTPPVLEEWGGSLVAIEGNTRVFMLHKERRETMHALVVRGVTEPLPGRPVSPSRVLLHTSSLPSAKRIDGFDFDRFRSIEGSVRPVA